MKRKTTKILLAVALLLVLTSIRMTASSSLPPWIKEANIINIAERGHWWLDKDGDFQLQDIWGIQQSDLTPFSKMTQWTPMYSVVWAAFRYENVQDIIPTNPIWISAGFYETMKVFHLRSEGIDSISCGAWVSKPKLPISENYIAAPLINEPSPGDVILLRFHNPSGANLGIKDVFLVSPGQEVLLRNAIQSVNTSRVHFFIVFFSGTLLLLILVGLTWYMYRIPSIPFLGLYLLIYLAYYLLHFEREQLEIRLFFHWLGEGQMFLEVFLGLASLGVLLSYLEKLLNLKHINPSLSRAIHLSIVSLWVVLPGILIAGLLVNEELLGRLHLLFKTGYLAMILTVCLALFFQHKDFPSALLAAAGTLIMAIGQLMALSGQLFGGPLVKEIAGGAFGYYLLSNGHEIPVFDTKFGLLLETCFFSLAFMWNQKREKEILKNNNEIAESQLKVFQLAAVPASDNKDSGFYDFPIPTDFVEAAVLLVEKNLVDENFGVQELAVALNISRRLLFQKIQADTSLSPSAFIRSIRLRHARQMLENTEVTISEIAFAVGFKYAYYFSKVFKEEFGVNPSDWPRQKKQRNTQKH